MLNLTNRCSEQDGRSNGLPDVPAGKCTPHEDMAYPNRRVGHVVHTKRETVAEPRLQRKTPALRPGRVGLCEGG